MESAKNRRNGWANVAAGVAAAVALCAPVGAGAEVRVLLDAVCARGDGGAALERALGARGADALLDATLTVEPTGEGGACEAWVEVEGARTSLGPATLEDAASAQALAALAAWVLDAQGALAVHAAAVRASGTLGASGVVAEEVARGAARRHEAARQAHATLDRALEVSAYTAAAAQTPDEEVVQVEDERPEWLSRVGAAATLTSLNGDQAALMGLDVVAMSWGPLEVGARGETNVTPVAGRFAYTILEDAATRREQPGLNVSFVEGTANAVGRLNGFAAVFGRGGVGAARVDRVTDDAALARGAWSPTATVGAGALFALGPTRLETSVAYRWVGGLDWIGPEPMALSAPSVRVVLSLVR